MQNRSFLTIPGLLLLPLLLLLYMSGCKKEKLAPMPSNEDELSKYKTASGAELVHRLPDEQPEVFGGLQERDNDWNHNKKPVYSFSDGVCRVVFRIYGYDPSLIHGGFNPPCSNAGIVFKGYSAPDGQGVLLFTQYMEITGGWQVLTIPQNAYIQFQINQVSRQEEGPCRFKFVTGDFGWNRAVFEWHNIPYDEWLPVIMGRFPPKDNSTGGNFNLYAQYLCDSWCTWTVPVSYTTTDPWPIPWTTTRLACFYGPVPPFIYYQDPRIIKDHFIYEKSDQTVYFYPITGSSSHIYSSFAKDLGGGINYDVISYWVLGANGQGAGPLGWGPFEGLMTQEGCNIILVSDE